MAAVREADRSVIVVAGVPRSGTSLMMQMLRAGGVPLLSDDARPPDRHNPRGYLEYAPVRRGRHDPTWLDCAVGRAVKVVHTLVPELPGDRAYRVILMRRAWGEVLASQRAMLGAPSPGPDDARLIAIFAAQLEAVERWVAGRRQASLLRVDYNALVADPGPGVAALDAFLGGSLDRVAMAAAVDASLRRQRAS